MQNTNLLRETCESLLARILAQIAPDKTFPGDLGGQFSHLSRLKAELGGKEVAARLKCNPAELDSFQTAISVAVNLPPPAATGASNRNSLLAHMRLLSWLETLWLRLFGEATTLPLSLQASEDRGRCQVRALELILRDLVNESYETQQDLIQRLEKVFGTEIVGKWQSSADPGNILTGTTFSELASLYCNKQEFERYKRFYEDTVFLSLFGEKRRTLQQYLEDVRRIRNSFAHNKHLSDVSLSLLDLYFEELVEPVSAAARKGHTRVNPDTYQNPSTTELDSYFSIIRGDLQSVKDDIRDLKDALLASLQDIQSTTTKTATLAEKIDSKAALIETRTRGLNRRLLVFGGIAAVGLVIAAVTLLLVTGNKETSQQILKTAGDSSQSVERIAGEVKGSKEVAQQVLKRVGEGSESLKQIADDSKGSKEVARETLAKVGEGNEALKQVARETKENAKAIKDSVRAIEKSAKSLDDAAKELKRLDSSGGLVARPKTPAEFYHNARLHAQRGEVDSALEMYQEFFTFHLQYADPVEDVVALLRGRYGAAGLTDTITNLLSGKLPADLLGYALLIADTDGARQVDAAFRDYANQPNPYPPAILSLIPILKSGIIGGTLSHTELANRFKDYARTLQRSGQLTTYYLDQLRYPKRAAVLDSENEALDPFVSAWIYDPFDGKENTTMISISVEPHPLKPGADFWVTLYGGFGRKKINLGRDIRGDTYLSGIHGEELPLLDPKVAFIETSFTEANGIVSSQFFKVVQMDSIQGTAAEKVKAGVLRYFKDRESFELQRDRELRTGGSSRASNGKVKAASTDTEGMRRMPKELIELAAKGGMATAEDTPAEIYHNARLHASAGLKFASDSDGVLASQTRARIDQNASLDASERDFSFGRLSFSPEAHEEYAAALRGYQKLWQFDPPCSEFVEDTIEALRFLYRDQLPQAVSNFFCGSAMHLNITLPAVPPEKLDEMLSASRRMEAFRYACLLVNKGEDKLPAVLDRYLCQSAPYPPAVLRLLSEVKKWRLGGPVSKQAVLAHFEGYIREQQRSGALLECYLSPEAVARAVSKLGSAHSLQDLPTFHAVIDRMTGVEGGSKETRRLILKTTQPLWLARPGFTRSGAWEVPDPQLTVQSLSSERPKVTATIQVDDGGRGGTGVGGWAFVHTEDVSLLNDDDLLVHIEFIEETGFKVLCSFRLGVAAQDHPVRCEDMVYDCVKHLFRTKPALIK